MPSYLSVLLCRNLKESKIISIAKSVSVDFSIEAISKSSSANMKFITKDIITKLLMDITIDGDMES